MSYVLELAQMKVGSEGVRKDRSSFSYVVCLSAGSFFYC